jgi:protein-disulfide isomerase
MSSPTSTDAEAAGEAETPPVQLLFGTVSAYSSDNTVVGAAKTSTYQQAYVSAGECVREGARVQIMQRLFFSRFSWPQRRSLLGFVALSAVAALGVIATTPSFAKEGPSEVSITELMKPTDLPDITLGPADAKVTVVEYASMTCPHCAHFANEIFDPLKKKYIDSGKIRFVFREFPLDNLAAAASMLARCAGDDKTFPLIETFYAKQADWAFTQGNPVPKLFDIAKQAGFTQESFDKCLTNQKLLDQITAGRSRASDTFGVNATPTFFINGKRLQEAPSMEAFDKVIEPLLAAK